MRVSISFLSYTLAFAFRSSIGLSIVFSSKDNLPRFEENKHQHTYDCTPYFVYTGWRPHNTSILVCGANVIRVPIFIATANCTSQTPSNLIATRNTRNIMPRTLPWLTRDAVKKESTPHKRIVKHEPDSDHDKTPKASQNAGGQFDNEKSDILRSCEHFPLSCSDMFQH